jgi:hypothetical protein
MKIQEPIDETEILGADERRISEMCCALKKIEAPKDFEHKLKARIARSTQSDFQPRFGWAFRYAAPAFALLVVLGLLFFGSGIFSGSREGLTAQTQPETQTPTALQPQNTMVSGFAPRENTPDSNTDQTVIPPANQSLPKISGSETARIDSRKPAKDASENRHEPGRVSKDFSVTPARQLNVNSNMAPRIPQIIERESPMNVKEILLMNGINADLENGKWTVKSVTSNGVGESSDIKQNDVIEAIDSQTLSGETVFNKTVKGTTVTVTRNGEKIQIKLRTKQ